MHSPETNSSGKGRLDISDVGPRFSSTKVVAAAIRGALILAVLLALVLIAARPPAQAQTETVLYNFTGGSDGGSPQSRLTFDSAGNLYGTTNSGGLGYGTVFELSPNGNGGWNETVLYSFTGGADGANPNYCYVTFDSVGNLYGTAYGGGANGYGVVFKLSPEGASWTETVLYSFAGGTDGANPVSGLIMDPVGNLYGTSNRGDGTSEVFELSPSGGGWTEQVIYQENYGGSLAGLTMDAEGNIFGPTINAFTGLASVFELSPNGNGGWTPTVIYNFPCTRRRCPIGAYPDSPLVLDPAGNLYGAALYGGGAESYGTVYKLSPGNGTWKGVLLHDFKGGPTDGSHPTGIVINARGNIFGTTQQGGKHGSCCGDGTLFELVPGGSYKVLWNFNDADGFWPSGAPVLDSAGRLYGTTVLGGSRGNGVAFKVDPKPAATTTEFSTSPDPSTYGQPVTFTAVVTSSAGAPPDGETITFREGKTVLGTGTLSGGSASFTTSTLNVGVMFPEAVYGGDPDFLGSTSCQWNQRVYRDPTTTTLSSSLNPSSYGQAVTLTATVTTTGPNQPTGTVTFKNGSETLRAWELHSGVATWTLANIPVGANTLTAKYDRDGWNDVSVSAAITQTVNPASVSMVLASTPNPSTYGKPVKYSATLTSTGGLPSGQTVTFSYNNATLGTAIVNGEGVATFWNKTPPKGSDVVTAAYAGSADYSSASASVTQVVKYLTTTLSSSLNPSNYGQAVTLTATVTSAGPTPTGTVIFKNGSETLGSGTLNAGGVATLTTAKIPVGANTLTATYLGDAFNGKSVSAAITQTVSQASVSMVLTSTPNPSTFGRSVHFTATLTSNGGVPSGQPVTFSYNDATLGTAIVGSKGVATFSTTTLPQGSDVVTAAYAGSVDYSSASATVTQVVN